MATHDKDSPGPVGLAFVVSVAVLLALSMADGCAVRTIEPAHFDHGAARILRTANIGTAGGTLEVLDARVSPDRVVITIPPGAVTKDVTFTVGFDDGKLIGATGVPSAEAVFISAESVQSFAVPVELRVDYRRSTAPKTIVGYAVDTGGQLRPIDLLFLDRQRATVTFATFRPLTFIWLYIE
jgi:hypothetical protein